MVTLYTFIIVLDPYLSSQTSWPPWSDLLQTALPHGSPSSSGHVSPGPNRPWLVWQPAEEEWCSSGGGGPESRRIITMPPLSLALPTNWDRNRVA